MGGVRAGLKHSLHPVKPLQIVPLDHPDKFFGIRPVCGIPQIFQALRPFPVIFAKFFKPGIAPVGQHKAVRAPTVPGGFVNPEKIFVVVIVKIGAVPVAAFF
jgi:hypothetical protein